MVLDPPCIRDTIRDVQRHMGASTWVKSVQKSVKITSRKLMDTGHFRPFGRRGLGRTRPWSLVVDGKDPPCIRDTFRDVQRHMGASTWVKDDQKSVKITSRKLMDTCHFRPFGRRGLDRARPWTTERIPRAYETLSETFRDTWVQVHG